MAQAFTAATPAIVAGTDPTTPTVITELPLYGGENFAIGRVMFTPTAAQASPGAVNYAILTVRYVRAGGAAVNIAQLSLANVALVAEVPVEIPLTSGVREQENLQAGDVVDLAVTHAGTGSAVPAGEVTVEAGA